VPSLTSCLASSYDSMEFVLARSQKMMMMIALGIGHSGTSAGIPGTSLVITLADEHIDTMFRDATLAR